MTPPTTPSNTPPVPAEALSAPSARPTTREGRRRAGQRPRLLRLTPKLRASILEMILTGVPIGTAAVACGIPKRTFFDWLSKGRGEDAADPYRTFAVEVDEAQEAWAARAVRRIDAAGEKDYRALAWLLERRRPDEFGDPAKGGVVVNVGVLVESAEWRDLSQRLLDRLSGFPEALAAVADLMAGPGVVDGQAVELAELEAA